MTAGVRWALFSGSGVSELFADTHMGHGAKKNIHITARMSESRFRGSEIWLVDYCSLPTNGAGKSGRIDQERTKK